MKKLLHDAMPGRAKIPAGKQLKPNRLSRWLLICSFIMTFFYSNRVNSQTPVDSMLLCYSTYLGGSNYEHFYWYYWYSNDNNFVAPDGSIFLYGETNSADFPVTPGAFQPVYGGGTDGFIIKLDASGNTVYATYIGGSSHDIIYRVEILDDGSAVFIGETNSADLPVTPGAFQSVYGGGYSNFILKLDASGNVVYATYIATDVEEYIYGVEVLPDGSAVFTGITNSADFPVTPGAFQPVYGGGEDGFIVKLDASGNTVYATYVGGSDYEHVNNVNVSPDGSVVFIGSTGSADFPVTPGALQPVYGGDYDGFVLKLDASGNAVYSTYLGGSGSDYNYSARSFLLGDGSVVVHGETNSVDFPVSPGAFQSVMAGDIDWFVTKLDASGNMVYSTYIGGSNYEYIYNSLINNILSDGSVILTGITGSTDFPVTPGAFQPVYGGGEDGFIVKLDASGNAVYSTYLGGSGYEEPWLLDEVLLDGSVMFTGYTSSSDFPVTPGAFQPVQLGGGSGGFVVKLDASGNAVYSTYMGGDYWNYNRTLLDDGSIVMSGYTSSADFPVTPGAFQPVHGGGLDTYVVRLDASGNAVYSTYLGGSSDDYSYSGYTYNSNLGVFPDGSVMVIGMTYSSDFPVTPGALQPVQHSGGYGAYMTKFSPMGDVLYSTYFGGNSYYSNPQLTYVYPDGSLGVIGQAHGADYPVTPDAYQPVYGGNTDIAYTRIRTLPYPVTEENEISPVSQTQCVGGPIQQIRGNRATGGAYRWQVSEGGAGGPWTDIPGAVLQNYTPVVGVVDRWYRRVVMGYVVPDFTGDCSWEEAPVLDTVSVSNVSFVAGSEYNAPVVNAGPNVYTCPGIGVLIGGFPSVTGGTPPYTYEWDMGANLSDSTVAHPVATVEVTTIFTLRVTDANGCSNIDQVVVSVNRANAGPDVSFCEGGDAVRIGTAPKAGEFAEYSWSPAAGLSCTDCPRPWASPLTETVYILEKTIMITEGTCTTSDTVVVRPIVPPIQVLEDVVMCYSSPNRFQIGYAPEGAYNYTWAPGSWLENNNSSSVYFNSGSQFLHNASAIYSNPFTYYLTIEEAGCAWYDTMQVVMIRADAGSNGCGPRTIGRDWHPQIAATYQWTVLSGPDNITGSYNTAVTTVDGSDTETSTYQLEVCYDGVCCTDVVVVPPCGCYVSISVAEEADCSETDRTEEPLRLTASGGYSGVMPYDAGLIEYSWSPCAGLDTCQGPVVYVTDNVPRTYTVTMTHPDFPGSGCSYSVNVAPPAISVPVFEAGEYAICDIGETIQIGEPMIAGYAYFWTGPDGFSSALSNPSVTPTELPAEYYVTVTDIGTGCTFLDTAYIHPGVIADAGEDITICNEAIVRLGIPDESGGLWEYYWEPTASPWQNGTNEFSAQPEVLVATELTFVLTVTNPEISCTKSDTVDIFIVSDGVIDLNMPDIEACYGETVTLGLPEVFLATYFWSPAAGLSCTNCANPEVIAGSDAVYYVEVYLPGDCPEPSRDTIHLTVHPLPEVDLTDIEKCANETAELNPGLSGACEDCTYGWSPATGLSDATAINPTTTVATQTDYTLTVTTEHGCSSEAVLTVTIEEDGVLTLDPVVKCLVAVTELNPGLVGECEDCTYAWSPVVGLNDPNILNPETNTAVSRTYVLTVTDPDGCISTGSVSVTIEEEDVLTLDPVTKCPVAVTELNPGLVGECTGCTYVWSPVTGLNDPNILNPETNTALSRTYALTVTDPDGCISTASVSVNIIPDIALQIPPVRKCPSESVELNPGLVGECAGCIYQWAPSANLDDPSVLNPVTNTPFSRTYGLTVTYPDGCRAYGSFFLSVGAEPVNAGAARTICLGESTELGHGSNDPSWIYLWSPEEGLNDPGIPNPVFTPTSAGIYTFSMWVEQGPGCTASAQVTVTVLGVDVVEMEDLYDICENTCVQIGPSNNSSQYSYYWSPATGLSCTDCAQPVACPEESTRYTLTIVHNMTGCTGERVVDVNVLDIEIPVLSIEENEPVCRGSVVQIEAEVSPAGSYDYEWTPGTGLSNRYILEPVLNTAVLPAGIYTYIVEVTDNVSGCANIRDTFEIEIWEDQLSLNLVVTDFGCDSTYILVEAVLTGVYDEDSYVWQTTGGGMITELSPVLIRYDLTLEEIAGENIEISFSAEGRCGTVVTSAAQLNFDVCCDLVVSCADVTDVTAECGTDLSPDALGWPEVSGSCGTVEITYTNVILSYGCSAETGVLARTFVIEDDLGNSYQCVQVITVEDTTAPVFDQELPQDITVECNAVPDAVILTATDNCGSGPPDLPQKNTVNLTVYVDFTEDRTEGDCAGSSVITRTWTATDACGNEAVHIQVITVEDTTAPEFDTVPPADTIVLECGEDIPPAATITATADCSTATVYVDELRIDGICMGTYTIERRWVAVDECGNMTVSAPQIIEINDVTGPEFNELLPPLEMTFECSDTIPDAEILTASDCSYNIMSDEDGNFRLDGSILLQVQEAMDGYNTNNGDPFGVVGTYLVTDYLVGATPEQEAEYEGITFTITTTDLSDGTYPSYVGPNGFGSGANIQNARLQIEFSSDVLFTVNGKPNMRAQERIDFLGDGTILVPYPNGIGSHSHPNLITSVTGPYYILNPLPFDPSPGQHNVNAIPPTGSGTRSIYGGTGTLVVVEHRHPFATGTNNFPLFEVQLFPQQDLVAFEEVVTPGDCVGSSVITRTWTATDECGNETIHVQVITVEDTTAPEFVEDLPADITVECDAIPEAEELTATDNCGDAEVEFTEELIPGADISTYEIERTWTATDSCGNEITHRQTITVVNCCTLEVVCPSETVALECDESLSVSDLGEPVVLESCGDVEIIYIDSELSGGCSLSTGVFTRTFSITDEAGNTEECVQTITVEDTTAPEFVEDLPVDITVECDAVPEAEVLTATDNCGDAEVEFEEAIAEGDCAGSSVITRTWTATDECGNETVHVQVVTVEDTTAPEFVEDLPVDITVECDAIPEAEELTATDNCGVAEVEFEEAIAEGDCAGSSVITRTWTATDECGNETVHVQVVTVEDTTAPEFLEDLPVDITVECDSIPEADVLTVTDNCGDAGVEFEEAMAEGDCAGSSVITRTWTATDECGNETVHVQVVTVEDTTAPEFVEDLPADITVECDAVPEAEELTATDNCGDAEVEFVEDIAEGDCAGSSVITRTWTATDECGNETVHVQVVTVEDTTTPEFVEDLPADITVECDAVPEAEELTATDNCSDAEVEFEEAIAEGDCAGSSVITRTWTAMDECGNETVHVQVVTVEDTTAPEFVEDLPADITVECDAIPEAEVLTATDNCGDAEVEFVEDIAEGDCAGSSVITRIWMATDECGNETVHVQVVTVEDTTAPEFVEDLPADITVECDAIPEAEELTATDNCGDAGVEFEEAIAEGDCAGSSVITRTWTATDECGNETVHVQVITVEDTTAPEFVEDLPVDITVECDAVPEAEELTATDNCSNAEVEFGEDIAEGDCAGSSVITRTWTAKDECGNETVHIQVITVEDNTAPEFIEDLPADITVECDAVPEAEVLTATDNCSDAEVVFTEVRIDGNCPGSYTLTRAWTATDECGNETAHVQVVTVEDTTAPEIEITDPVFAGVENGGIIEVECYATDPEWEYPVLRKGGVEVYDVCSSVEFEVGETFVNSGDCKADGFLAQHFYLITATDDCANVTTLEFELRVVDKTPPVIYGVPGDTTVTCNNIPVPVKGGCHSSEPAEIYVIDECECASLEFEEIVSNKSCDYNYDILRRWTATDNCGNVTVAEQRIYVRDDSGPAFIFHEPVLETIPNGSTYYHECVNGEFPEWSRYLNGNIITAVDGCSGVAEVLFRKYEDRAFSYCEDGVTEKWVYEWSAKDACGNEHVYGFSIAIVDRTGPQFIGEPVLCEAGESGYPVVVDGCSEVIYKGYDDRYMKDECGRDIIERTWVAYDICNNAGVFEQKILLGNTGIVFNVKEGLLPEGFVSGDMLRIDCGEEYLMEVFRRADAVTGESDCIENVNLKFSQRVETNKDCADGISRIHIYSWRGEDECGNVSEFEVRFGITDTRAPYFHNNATNLELTCGEAIPLPQVSDGCSEVKLVLVRQDTVYVSVLCERNVAFTQVYEAVDACGNKAVFERHVSIADEVGPVFISPQESGCIWALEEPVVVDGCEGIVEKLEYVDSPVLVADCGLYEYIERRWVASDACGNASELTQKLLVSYNFDAVEVRNPYIGILDQGGSYVVECGDYSGAVPALFTVSDIVNDTDCGLLEAGVSVEVVTSYDCTKNGGISVRYRVVYSLRLPCDTVYEHIVYVDVRDTQAPVFVYAPEDKYLGCYDPGLFEIPEIEEGCSHYSLEYREEVVENNYEGQVITYVYRTWTATDLCGNTSVHTQLITIREYDNNAEIILLNTPYCNSTDNKATVEVDHYANDLHFEWKVISGDCIITGGQHTQTITYFIGFSPVRLRVTITDRDGCVIVREITFVCDRINLDGGPRAIAEDFNGEEEILLYPNPTRYNLYLEWEAKREEVVKVRVISVGGVMTKDVLVSQKKGYNKLEIDVHDFTSGVYIIELEEEYQTRHAKFVKIE